MARHTLSYRLTAAEPLTYSVLETVLMEAGAVLNCRPLAIRQSPEDDVVAIYPVDIHLGRAHRQRPELAAMPQLPEDLSVLQAMDHQQHLVAEWANQWMAQVLPETVP